MKLEDIITLKKYLGKLNCLIAMNELAMENRFGIPSIVYQRNFIKLLAASWSQ